MGETPGRVTKSRRGIYEPSGGKGTARESRNRKKKTAIGRHQLAPVKTHRVEEEEKKNCLCDQTSGTKSIDKCPLFLTASRKNRENGE